MCVIGSRLHPSSANVPTVKQNAITNGLNCEIIVKNWVGVREAHTKYL